MALIPEGLFLMGSTEEDIGKLLELDRNVEAGRFDVEHPSARGLYECISD